MKKILILIFLFVYSVFSQNDSYDSLIQKLKQAQKLLELKDATNESFNYIKENLDPEIFKIYRGRISYLIADQINVFHVLDDIGEDKVFISFNCKNEYKNFNSFKIDGLARELNFVEQNLLKIMFKTPIDTSLYEPFFIIKDTIELYPIAKKNPYEMNEIDYIHKPLLYDFSGAAIDSNIRINSILKYSFNLPLNQNQTNYYINLLENNISIIDLMYFIQYVNSKNKLYNKYYALKNNQVIKYINNEKIIYIKDITSIELLLKIQKVEKQISEEITYKILREFERQAIANNFSYNISYSLLEDKAYDKIKNYYENEEMSVEEHYEYMMKLYRLDKNYISVLKELLNSDISQKDKEKIRKILK
jgi:hypothetical protein